MDAPTRPRDVPRGPYRDGPYEGARDGPPPGRGFGRGGRGSHHSGPPPHRGGRHFDGPPARQSSYDSYGPPAGPRNGHGAEARPAHDAPPPFKPNNSSSTTYPRTQRFNTHLDDLPKLVEGGRKAPSSTEPGTASRLAALEAEQKKLLEIIDEKQRLKRQGLREWERAEQETSNAVLRSELAEAHLEKLAGGKTEVGGVAY